MKKELWLPEGVQARQMVIVDRTADWVIVQKPVGVSSEVDGMGRMLAETLGVPMDSVYPVHRLDREVGGLMVYALKKETAARLSRFSAEGRMRKTYLAMAQGIPDEPEGRWEDLLFHDARRNKTFVVDRMRKGVKPAVLNYRVIRTMSEAEQPEGADGPATLMEISLETGRTHQIRVQCASRKMPLLHDRKYGGTGKGDIGLYAWKLSFPDPGTGEDRVYISEAVKKYMEQFTEDA